MSAERTARYRANHPEKFTKEVRAEKRKKSDKKYKENHGVHPMNIAGTSAYAKYRKSEKYRKSSVNSHLKRTYGISLDDYEEILKLQNGGCAICGSTVHSRKYKDGRIQRVPLFVDHCHETGDVRGLLCNKCNSGLGNFRDVPDLLIKAAAYLVAAKKE